MILVFPRCERVAFAGKDGAALLCRGRRKQTEDEHAQHDDDDSAIPRTHPRRVPQRVRRVSTRVRTLVAPTRIPYYPSRYNRGPAMTLLEIRGLTRTFYGKHLH